MSSYRPGEELHRGAGAHRRRGLDQPGALLSTALQGGEAEREQNQEGGWVQTIEVKMRYIYI